MGLATSSVQLSYGHFPSQLLIPPSLGLKQVCYSLEYICQCLHD